MVCRRSHTHTRTARLPCCRCHGAPHQQTRASQRTRSHAPSTAYDCDERPHMSLASHQRPTDLQNLTACFISCYQPGAAQFDLEVPMPGPCGKERRGAYRNHRNHVTRNTPARHTQCHDTHDVGQSGIPKPKSAQTVDPGGTCTRHQSRTQRHRAISFVSGAGSPVASDRQACAADAEPSKPRQVTRQTNDDRY